MSVSIVCGVDGSDESLAAAAVAGRLAEGIGARLVLGQVVKPTTTFIYRHQVRTERRWRRADGRAASLFSRIERGLSGIEVEGRVVPGVPAQSLLQLASEEDAMFLVVGSRGRGALRAALLGSVCSAAVRASDRPVVVVPPDAAQQFGRDAPERLTVVCGVDDSKEATEAARVAARLAPALGLELVLVHAYEPAPSGAAIPAPGLAPRIDREAVESRRRDRARSMLEAVAYEVEEEAPARLRVELGPPAAALDRSADEEHAELIVVGTHGRGPFASALLGSTSARLAASASRPVVVVPLGVSLRIDEAIDIESAWY